VNWRLPAKQPLLCEPLSLGSDDEHAADHDTPIRDLVSGEVKKPVRIVALSNSKRV
jgi:hypothetical protein